MSIFEEYGAFKVMFCLFSQKIRFNTSCKLFCMKLFFLKNKAWNFVLNKLHEMTKYIKYEVQECHNNRSLFTQYMERKMNQWENPQPDI